MNDQGARLLQNLDDEHSGSVSIDSLEGKDGSDERRVRTSNKEADSLDLTQENDSKCPSFHDVLSSSILEEEELLSSETGDQPGANTQDCGTLAGIPVFVCQKQVETVISNTTVYTQILCKDTASALSCRQSDTVFKDCQSEHNLPEQCPLLSLPPAHPVPGPRHTRSTVKVQTNSKIPLAVRSKSVTSTGQTPESEPPPSDANPAPPTGDMEDSVPPSEPSIPVPPKAIRSHSHHTIERPAKDFIKLNRQGEFRRNKTYHTLHVAKRDESTTDTAASRNPSEEETTETNPISKDLAMKPRQKASKTNTYDGPEHEEAQLPAQVPTVTQQTNSSKQIHSNEAPPKTVVSHPMRAPPGAPDAPEGLVSVEPEKSGGDRRTSRIPVPLRLSPGRSRTFQESPPSLGSSSCSLTATCRERSSLIDLSDHQQLLSDVSAPSLLDLKYQPRRRRDPQQTDGGSSNSLQSAWSTVSGRQVKMPPVRSSAPRRRVDFKPNLKPYPRKYISLGKLGPDPEKIKNRQEKTKKQHEYAEQVAKINRVTVKPKGHLYSKQESEAQNSFKKMVTYAKTVPKPKQKPKPQPPRASSPESMAMSKIKRLLDGNSLEQAVSQKLSPRQFPLQKLSPREYQGSSSGGDLSDPRPAELTAGKPPPAVRSVSPQRPSLTSLQPSVRPQSSGAPAFLPPSDAGRRGRRPASRSSSLTSARVSSSLSRMRSLTEQLMEGVSSRACADESGHAAEPAERPRRDDSCTTLGEGSDADSLYSADSVSARQPVVSLGKRHGSSSPRGRGLFPPPRGAPSCRRPSRRCSRGVGPTTAPRGSAEDVFYDPIGEASSEEEYLPPEHRRPYVSRGTQSALNDTFVVRKDIFVVDIGLPPGPSQGHSPRGPRRSPRSRLGDMSPDSLAGSPRDRRLCVDELTPNAAALQRLRERHSRDKQRLDELLARSVNKR